MQALDGLGGLGGPVFDALGFVEHDDVGAEMAVDVEAVGHDLLVVDDGEKGRATVGVVFRAGGAGAEDELVGERGESYDLFLPLGLERGGGDDKDALGFSQMVEQGAGGDGLDGFSESHFVGKQRTFAESEVEHTFALIGIERVERDVLGVAAGDDAGLVIAAELSALGDAAAVFEEGLDVLGDADLRMAAEFFKGSFEDGVRPENTVGSEHGTEAGREFGEIPLDAERVAIGNEVDVGRAIGFRDAVLALESAFQQNERGFDVLAGAQAGGAEVGAGAGKRAVFEVTDFNLIGHAAGGFHREGGEDRVLRVEVGNRVLLVAGTLDAAEDFVLIRGAPVSGGRERNRGWLLPGCFLGGHNVMDEVLRHAREFREIRLPLFEERLFPFTTFLAHVVE